MSDHPAPFTRRHGLGRLAAIGLVGLTGSRVMAGLHFRFACNAGLRLGERIGRYTVTNHLRAV